VKIKQNDTPPNIFGVKTSFNNNGCIVFKKGEIKKGQAKQVSWCRRYIVAKILIKCVELFSIKQIF
jgi:hypothetical protein